MSFRHLVFAGALALSSCSTPTEGDSAKRHGKSTGDTVHRLVEGAAQEAGLGAIESRLAAGAAEKLANNPEKAEAALDKAQDYLKDHPDKRKKLEEKAKTFLNDNPELKRALGDLLN